MCLYPRIVENPKYKPNKKNGGIVPPIFDQRARAVPIGCGTCLECRKQKGREWTARLNEDIKEHRNGKFVTLTFSTESLKKLYNDNEKLHKLSGYDLDNAIVTRAVRLFLERWRKKYKKSLRHWLITELGSGQTEHIHLHGIVWTDEINALPTIWSYGYVWKGYEVNGQVENYVSARTVNYIVKYVSKMDEHHLNYKPIILTSAGIGAHYIKANRHTHNRFEGKKTSEYYRTDSGHKIALPIYYRNKIYTDQQREELWMHKLDKCERWILGKKINISNGEELYYTVLEEARETTIRLGYPKPEFIWKKRKYEEDRRRLIHENRLGILRKTAEIQAGSFPDKVD